MTGMEAELRRAQARPKLDVRAHLSVTNTGNTPPRFLLNEDAFVSMLYLERRRAERARKRFVLVLLDVKKLLNGVRQRDRTIQSLTNTLSEAIRETDVIGWYLQDSLLGVIGTELGDASHEAIKEKFLEKLHFVSKAALGEGKSSSIVVSIHFFPEDNRDGGNGRATNIHLYPEFPKRESQKRVSLAIKRFIDILGSSAALVLLSPVFAAVAVAIRLTSKGPVLFRQERLGLCGKPFTLMKFRSMRKDCDAKIHEQYVKQFIAGQVEEDSGTAAKPVFKIQRDPRVTSVGQFIRKTSLDELPQFWNVLCGNMSLVGPRPPILYEYRAYEAWHRRRVLEIKPGITGLWQVEGRSRTRFDDMVRLDLKYARAWSIWLDLKILAQTPAAVIQGEGAH